MVPEGACLPARSDGARVREGRAHGGTTRGAGPDPGSELAHAGLIVAERRGTSIVYSLNAPAFEDALAAVLELLHAGEGRKERKP